ncbi:MAG: Carboxybiotin decarboxylase [Lachnoclostridium sp.]
MLIPKNLRGQVVKPKPSKISHITSKEKLIFAVVVNTILCLLFPVAAPLFISFFLGIAIRESGVEKYITLIENVFLYASTFFLGLMLGVLCDAQTILDPKVIKLLLLGMLALLLSGIGGIIGGYIVYFFSKKNFNPVIGIAGVSCVPTTAKVAQKEASKANKLCFIMEYALSANICGVITTAILTGLYITLIGH